jgi:mono/diheme cytochrome c family protein
MDIPVFHLDFLNDRLLIALCAIVHVVINHAMAVGGIPLVALLEWRAWRSGDPDADAAARRIMSVFFVVTTTAGALSGVGIWFSTGLVNPYAIGSLLRVFFWTWFVEWLVFVTEVGLILAYTLTWPRWTGARKRAHVRLGFALGLASWVTMALIVSILGFMMDPGAWRTDKTLLSGMLNPLYLPQLAFRTPLAMVMAGAAGLLLVRWAAGARPDLRRSMTRAIALWTLAWLPLCLAGGTWYARALPPSMAANVPTALVTQRLVAWSHQALGALALLVALVASIATWCALRPTTVARGALAIPLLACVALVGTFERVREFIRKPYAIADYLYANGYRKDDYPLLNRDGLLARATYASVSEITPDNRVEAGREVFRLACTRCHTVDGVNGIRGALHGLYGEAPWDADAIAAYVASMHVARPFMPPFPGSDAERAALGCYLSTLEHHRDTLEGAQSAGAATSPRDPRVAGAL